MRLLERSTGSTLVQWPQSEYRPTEFAQVLREGGREFSIANDQFPKGGISRYH